MNKIQLAATFYDANRALKTLLGDDRFYKTNIQYQDTIVKRMKHKNIPVMESVVQLLQITDEVVKDQEDKTVATMQLLAAAVELIEPKPKTRRGQKISALRRTAKV